MSENANNPMEISFPERRRRGLAVLLAFGTPVLLAAVTVSMDWIEIQGLVAQGIVEWVFLGNGMLAAAGTVTAVLIRPGTPPIKRAVGIVAGTVAGFMMYGILLGWMDSLFNDVF